MSFKNRFLVGRPSIFCIGTWERGRWLTPIRSVALSFPTHFLAMELSLGIFKHHILKWSRFMQRFAKAFVIILSEAVVTWFWASMNEKENIWRIFVGTNMRWRVSIGFWVCWMALEAWVYGNLSRKVRVDSAFILACWSVFGKTDVVMVLLWGIASLHFIPLQRTEMLVPHMVWSRVWVYFVGSLLLGCN